MADNDIQLAFVRYVLPVLIGLLASFAGQLADFILRRVVLRWYGILIALSLVMVFVTTPKLGLWIPLAIVIAATTHELFRLWMGPSGSLTVVLLGFYSVDDASGRLTRPGKLALTEAAFKSQLAARLTQHRVSSLTDFRLVDHQFPRLLWARLDHSDLHSLIEKYAARNAAVIYGLGDNQSSYPKIRIRTTNVQPGIDYAFTVLDDLRTLDPLCESGDDWLPDLFGSIFASALGASLSDSLNHDGRWRDNLSLVSDSQRIVSDHHQWSRADDSSQSLITKFIRTELQPYLMRQEALSFASAQRYEDALARLFASLYANPIWPHHSISSYTDTYSIKYTLDLLNNQIQRIDPLDTPPPIMNSYLSYTNLDLFIDLQGSSLSSSTSPPPSIDTYFDRLHRLYPTNPWIPVYWGDAIRITKGLTAPTETKLPFINMPLAVLEEVIAKFESAYDIDPSLSIISTRLVVLYINAMLAYAEGSDEHRLIEARIDHHIQLSNRYWREYLPSGILSGDEAREQRLRYGWDMQSHLAGVNMNVAPRALPEYRMPIDAGELVGRDDEVAKLVKYLETDERHHQPLVAAIIGEQGIGKTAIALHSARLMSEQWPDTNVSYVYLRDLAGNPFDPSQTLSMLLQAMGVNITAIPVDTADQARLLESMADHTRSLLVVDSVDSASQLVPLISTSASVSVIITSHSSLRDLEGIKRFRIGPLALDPAMLLLRHTARNNGINDVLAKRIVEFVKRRPLTVRIAGGAISSRQYGSPDAFWAQLQDEEVHFKESISKPGTPVGLATSYLKLLSHSESSQFDAVVLRQTSRLPGSPFTPEAVAAAVGVELTQVEASLKRLQERYLIEASDGGRFRLHESMRSTVYTLSQEQDSREDREAALMRLLLWYIEESARMSQALSTSTPNLDTTTDPQDDTETTECNDKSISLEAALDWFSWEYRVILSIIESASKGHDFDLVLALSGPLRVYFAHMGMWMQLEQLLRIALDAARKTNDLKVVGQISLAIGTAFARQFQWDEAETAFQEGLSIARNSKDIVGQATSLNNLGTLYHSIGRFHAAIDAYSDGFSLVSGANLPDLEVLLSASIGTVYFDMGEISRATECQRRSLKLAMEYNDDDGYYTAIMNLGNIYAHLNEWDSALDYLKRAYDGFASSQNRHAQGTVLLNLGGAYLNRGSWMRAIPTLEAASNILIECADYVAASKSMINLAQSHKAFGRVSSAIPIAESAAALAQRSNDKTTNISALVLLGDLLAEMGDTECAITIFREALDLAESIDDDAARLRCLMALGWAHINDDDDELRLEYLQQALGIAPRGSREYKRIRSLIKGLRSIRQQRFLG